MKLHDDEVIEDHLHSSLLDNAGGRFYVRGSLRSTGVRISTPEIAEMIIQTTDGKIYRVYLGAGS